MLKVFLAIFFCEELVLLYWLCASILLDIVFLCVNYTVVTCVYCDGDLTINSKYHVSSFHSVSDSTWPLHVFIRVYYIVLMYMHYTMQFDAI